VWVLIGSIATYVATFGTLTWQQHANFGTFGFDMGIYDQGIWLASRFEDPFVTVRGLNIFANHVDPIWVLFVPFYWLGAGPIFLSLVQATWMAAGAVPVYLLGRERLRNPWLGVALAAAYLLHPSLQWITKFHFHPEAFAVTPLLFAWWFAIHERWRWFTVMVVMALASKESVAMAVFTLGLVVAWKFHRRVGLVTSAAALGWFLVATRVIIPAATGGDGPFYSELYGQWGDNPLDIAQGILTNPSEVFDTVTHGDRLDYYRMMLAPVAFLPLLALPALAIGVPQVLVNVLSSHTLTHSIQYQYSTVVLAAMFIALPEAVGRRNVRMGGRRFLVGLVVATSLAANVAWSPSPIGVDFRSGIWSREPRARHIAINEALDQLPDHASVSATYYVVPHVTHRELVYEFPNPFRAANWGLRGKDLDPPEDVEYLLVDTTTLGEGREVFEQLIAEDYTVELSRDAIVLARRRPG
jgi:uncharacterized membrane protein